MTNPLPQPLPPETMAEARHWIARLASGAITEAEMARFREWRAVAPNDQAFHHERALWRDLSAIEGAFAPQPSRRRGRSRASRWMAHGRRRIAAGAVAACLLAVLVGPELALMMRADYRSGTGEVRQVALSDGSRAILDTGSAIAVDFSSNRRDITLLSGRAWFEVRHGDARPFRVAALGGLTQDIGTAFEVDRGDGRVDVGVTEGAVRVTSPDNSAPTLLTAGQRGRYAQGAMPKRIEGGRPETIAAWRTGELLIRDMPVESAIRAVARYRKAPVFTWGDTAALEPVSGTFRTDRPDDAIATLAQMRGLRTTRLSGGVLILHATSPAK